MRGWVNGEAKQNILRHASVLALPSQHENFGLCVVEALGCGVPVVVSPHVGLAGEIESRGAGWVSPVETEALSNTLAAALGDKEELHRRGAAGKMLAEKFNWKNVAEMLADLYQRVSGKK